MSASTAAMLDGDADAQAAAIEVMADSTTGAGTGSGVEVLSSPELDPEAAGVVVGGVTEPTPTSAVATRPTQALVDFGPSSGLVGEWTMGDVRVPALRIVAGSGELSKTFNGGTCILGDDVLLPPPDPKNPVPSHTFRFVPFRLRKQYKENLSQEEMAAGAEARFVDTVAEVEALGGTTQWLGRIKPTWSPSGTVHMLVEQPEDPSLHTNPNFSMELDGKLYCPAVYYASGTSFPQSAKVLFNSLATMLTVPVLSEDGTTPMRDGRGVIIRRHYLPKNYWSWRTIKRPSGDYTVVTPEIRMKGETGPEVRRFCDSMLSTLV
jgi:hypothetical protein